MRKHGAQVLSSAQGIQEVAALFHLRSDAVEILGKQDHTQLVAGSGEALVHGSWRACDMTYI